MRFNLSSEQQALADAATGLLDNCASHHRSALVDGDTSFDTECWRRASDELGLPGVAVSEDHDGAGGTLLDAAVVLEVAGRTLSPLPLWTSISAGRVLEGLADLDRAGELLAQVATGSVTPSLIGFQTGHDVEATGAEGARVLSGRAAHVVGGSWTDQLIVVATSDQGLGLFLVAADADGVTVAAERSLDPTRGLLSVTFDGAAATALSSQPLQPTSVGTVRAEIGILLAAEQVGTAQGALDMAVDYAKTRQQFGRAIGSFQSLKHLLADAYVDVSTSRDVTLYGAWSLSTGDDSAELTANLTRATVTPRTTRVCATNLQVHGGIGYTWEHSAHLYYKRAVSAAHLLGEARHALDAIADDIGLGAEQS